jgi:DegV family protein with EDD domain
MTVRVVTDSVSDIPADIVEELGITVVPAYVRFGNEVYKDGVELTTDEFFDRLMNGPEFPATSQPSVGDFSETYASVAEGAEGIVSVHVSSRVSGTVNSAQQGAGISDVGCPIEVMDTLQASMGSGLVAIAAAKAARDGGSLEDVTTAAKDAIERSQCICLLDTLEYLIKGGRIGKAKGMLGSLLRIKPLIIIRDGEVHDLAKERTRRKAISRLDRTAREFGPLESVAVMYSTSREEAERLAEALRPAVAGGEMPTVARFGPALGTYVGPDALGISLLSA